MIFERTDWKNCPYLYKFITLDDGRFWFMAKHMVNGTKTLVSFPKGRKPLALKAWSCVSA